MSNHAIGMIETRGYVPALASAEVVSVPNPERATRSGAV